MSATKGNLITRLPETLIIAALATVSGYLIHEATNDATTATKIERIEARISELEGLHPRQ